MTEKNFIPKMFIIVLQNKPLLCIAGIHCIQDNTEKQSNNKK